MLHYKSVQSFTNTILIICLCACSLHVWSTTPGNILEGVRIGSLNYDLDTSEETAAVTLNDDGYKNMPQIIIPSSVTYQGKVYTVTRIGSAAFAMCKDMKSVIIPNTVTSIADGAFFNCEGLVSVTIPNSVTIIEDEAFESCYNLTFLVLGENVSYIGSWAFARCVRLQSLSLPASVSYIGGEAFALCRSLTSISIPAGVSFIGRGAFVACFAATQIDVAAENPNYCSVDGVLYNKSKDHIYQYPAGKKDAVYDIPFGVKVIEYGSFQSCQYLTKLVIPSSVTGFGETLKTFNSIGEFVFNEECVSLKEIIYPEGLDISSIGIPEHTQCISYRPK